MGLTDEQITRARERFDKGPFPEGAWRNNEACVYSPTNPDRRDHAIYLFQCRTKTQLAVAEAILREGTHEFQVESRKVFSDEAQAMAEYAKRNRELAAQYQTL